MDSLERTDGCKFRGNDLFGKPEASWQIFKSMHITIVLEFITQTLTENYCQKNKHKNAWPCHFPGISTDVHNEKK